VEGSKRGKRGKGGRKEGIEGIKRECEVEKIRSNVNHFFPPPLPPPPSLPPFISGMTIPPHMFHALMNCLLTNNHMVIDSSFIESGAHATGFALFNVCL
jgi:hypothetical protein